MSGKVVSDAEYHATDKTVLLLETKACPFYEILSFTDFDVAAHEQRLGISDAEGLEHIDITHQWKANLAEAQLSIHFDEGHQRVG